MGIELRASTAYTVDNGVARIKERAMVGHLTTRPGRSLPRWSWLHVSALAVALQIVSQHPSAAAPAEAEDTWTSLATEIFKGRPLVDGADLVGIEMPARAEDAAIVPVTLRVTLPPGDGRRLNKLTLV